MGNKRSALPFLANLVSQILFGCSMLFVRMGMQAAGQDTFRYLAIRFAAALAVMTLLVLTRVVRVEYRGKPVRLLLLCGLLNPCISQIFETLSVTHAPTTQIAMLNSVVPLVVIFLCVRINGDRISRKTLLFCAAAVFGVFLTNFGGIGAGMTVLGTGLILGTVAAVSLGRVYVRQAGARFTGFETIYVTTAMGALLFTAISLLQHGCSGTLQGYFDGLLRWDFVGSVLYMSLGSAILAFTLMAYAAAKLPMGTYAAMNSVYTVVAVAAGVLVLHEPFTWLDGLGACIVTVGVTGAALSDARQKKPENTKMERLPSA